MASDRADITTGPTVSLGLRIHIGCGPDKKCGYINVDANPSVMADITAPAWALPLADGCAETVEAYHVIEHLSAWQVEQTIREWRRVLRPGGKVIVECPDLAKAAAWLVSTQDFSAFATNGMGRLFGEAFGNDYMTHKWGFTPETIQYLFESLGFNPVLLSTPQTHMPDRDLRVEAFKSSERTSMELDSLRVFWFLLGSKTVASSRLQGYLIHDWLRSRGVASEILLAPPNGPVGDVPWDWRQHWMIGKLVRSGVAVFQKLRGPKTTALIRYLRASGVRTVYVDADLEVDNQAALECDLVVCPSEALAANYRKISANSVAVIQDPVEFWLPPGKRPRTLKTQGLRVCWVGHSANWESLSTVQEVLREPEFQDIKLTTISDHPQAGVKWKLEIFPHVLRGFDFAVLPTKPGEAAAAKSANRLTMFMAAGLPVVAGRIPAYEAVLSPGNDGFMASAPEEFRQAFRVLRRPAVRQRVADAAYYKVKDRFSLGCTGAAWLTLLKGTNSRRTMGDWLYGPPCVAEMNRARKILNNLTLASCADQALRDRRMGLALLRFLEAVPQMLTSSECRSQWANLVSRSLRFSRRPLLHR